MRASVSAILVAVLLLPGASCSTQDSGFDPKGAPAPRAVQANTADEKHLLAAVRRYNEAFHTGDYDSVYRMQGVLCRELSWEDGLANKVKQYARRYGEPQRITSFRANVKRHIAYVSYTFEDRRLNRRGEVWTSGRDGWRYANC